MGFKPVNLCSTDRPICSAYSGKSFALPPTGIAKSSAQHGQDMNTATDSDRFNLGHLSNDVEIHHEVLYLVH
jgi:hypothetical protein